MSKTPRFSNPPTENDLRQFKERCRQTFPEIADDLVGTSRRIEFALWFHRDRLIPARRWPRYR